VKRSLPISYLFAALLLMSSTAARPADTLALPAEAVVIERTQIPQSIHRDRELVLWMLSPEMHDRGAYSESNGYTCREMTLGSYYSGPTRISLADTRTGAFINTIQLRYANRSKDTFDIPYRILADFNYLVPGHEKGFEGKPALLSLRDLNGDGLALEATFFEAEACMGLETTMIGYSPRQDAVIQYHVELRVAGMSMPRDLTWVDYLFSEHPTRPRHWSFTIDYTGRGGTLDRYDVHYDRSRERFFGALRSRRLEVPEPTASLE